MKYVLFARCLIFGVMINIISINGMFRQKLYKHIFTKSLKKYSQDIFKKWQSGGYQKMEYPIHFNDLCINSIKDAPLFYNACNDTFSFYKTNKSELFLKNKNNIYGPVIGNLKKIIELKPQKIDITGRHEFRLYRDGKKVGDIFNEFIFVPFKDESIGNLLREHEGYEIKHRISMNTDNTLVAIASKRNIFICTVNPFKVIAALDKENEMRNYAQVIMNDNGKKVAVLSKTLNECNSVLEFILSEK